MATKTLHATPRTVIGKQVGALRRAGQLPAVLYGRNREALPIQLEALAAANMLRRVSGAELLDLEVDGEVHKSLVREIQRDFIKGHLLHVDFYEVAMDRTLRVQIPISLIGSSPAAKSGDAVLVHGVTEIEIECLPADLISRVEVDLGELREVGQAIFVRDVYTPKTVKVLTDGDELVARVTYARAEEEVPTEAAGALPEVEVIEKGKKAEEEIEAAEEKPQAGKKSAEKK